MHSTLQIPLQNWIDGETILSILNREAAEIHTPDERRFSVRTGWVAKAERRKVFYDEVAGYLRLSVDRWLRTGVSADGVESPQSRKLIREHAVHRFFQYFSEHPPLVRLGTQGLDLVIGPPAEPLAERNELRHNAASEADSLFVRLMLSDWRYGLCKCRHCGRYFLNSKLRRSYARGTFCSPKHQSQASAIRRTTERRSKAQAALQRVAAEYLVRQGVTTSEWRRDIQLKSQLAAEISLEMSKNRSLCSGRNRVRTNWISRHSEQIEAMRHELAALAESSSKCFA
jgi:hypothetical protein